MNYEEYCEIISPTIKFNGGYPLALCICCNTIICYVEYNKNKDEYLVSYARDTCENVFKGEKIPLFCKECRSNNFLLIEKTYDYK